MEEDYKLRLFASISEKRYFYYFFKPPTTGGGGFLSNNLNEKYFHLDFELNKLSKENKNLEIKICQDLIPDEDERLPTQEESKIFHENLSKRFPDLNFIQDF
ncbi:MAG: hypothetical protein WC812_03850 [Candidatus Pacearchaeota archaeon]|jgi:hypothetical protein